MVMANKNIKETNNVTLSEVQQVLADAKEIDINLRNKLSKIKIHISGKESPELIKAVRSIFSDRYVDSKGNTTITYEMYCSVVSLLRQLGNSKAEEIL